MAAGLILAAGLAFAAPALAGEDAGAYLAAGNAFSRNDFPSAAQHFARAMLSDPKNTSLMVNAVISYVGAGDFERALVVARRLNSADPGNQIANMLLLSEAVVRQDFQQARSYLSNDAPGRDLVSGLARAWIEVGLGRMSKASASLDSLSGQSGLKGFALFHKALALALVGDFEGADRILSGKAGTGVPATRRAVIAHAQILSQLERDDAALALIRQSFSGDLDPALQALVDRLENGDTVPFTLVGNARDGLGEMFLGLADALNKDGASKTTLVYARLAQYLRPDESAAALLTAGMLEDLGQFDLATAVYESIPPDDPAFLSAELGRAGALRRAGKSEAEIEVLKQLAKSFPESGLALRALGDAYRRSGNFEQAAAAYDRAVALLGADRPSQWSLFYRRGIANERLGRWTAAEADFRKALELNPDQPLVLNYLGYSYVEKNTNLEEALSMIERAVKNRPDDGYITDSLGWALYRLGRYRQAVTQMERAVELVPTDPILNDHLGDVYWAVGRRREANFQWSRALSFGPEDKDAKRIRRKLELGLDKVLQEEGSPPLSVANDN